MRRVRFDVAHVDGDARRGNMSATGWTANDGDGRPKLRARQETGREDQSQLGRCPGIRRVGPGGSPGNVKSGMSLSVPMTRARIRIRIVRSRPVSSREIVD